MSDIETLEEFTRRYDILVGVGGGLIATDKQVAAIRGVLEEMKMRCPQCSAIAPENEKDWPNTECVVCVLMEENERLREGKALWSKQANDLEARIDAALALHFQRYPHGRDNPGFCADCIAPYPCPTVKILKGEK